MLRIEMFKYGFACTVVVLKKLRIILLKNPFFKSKVYKILKEYL